RRHGRGALRRAVRGRKGASTRRGPRPRRGRPRRDRRGRDRRRREPLLAGRLAHGGRGIHGRGTRRPAALAARRRRDPRPRVKRVLAWAGAALGALVVVAVAGVLIWSQTGVMAAEPDPLRDVADDPAIAYADGDAAITMSPADGAASGRGLVFIPGAKVDPAAYANRL